MTNSYKIIDETKWENMKTMITQTGFIRNIYYD